jgi:hypothetical protein
MLDNRTELPKVDSQLPRAYNPYRVSSTNRYDKHTNAIFVTSYFCMVVRRYFSTVSSNTTELLSLVSCRICFILCLVSFA